LQEPNLTSLEIFNALGEEVMTMINDEYLEAGQYYRKEFEGSRLASGMYVANLQSGNKIQMVKMMMVK